MELERVIELYQTAFTVCLVLGIISLAITVFLFFKFDIRRIFDMRTGRGAKRTIQQMEEVNAKTGKLRQEIVDSTPTKLRGEDRVSSPDTPLQPRKEKRQVQQQAEPQIQIDQWQQTDDGGQETEFLQEDTPETTLLQDDLPETTVLSEDMLTENMKKRAFPGAFTITKNVMWIHTKEII